MTTKHTPGPRLLAEAPAMLEALQQAAARLETYAEWASRGYIASRRNPILREIQNDATGNAREFRAILARIEGQS